MTDIDELTGLELIKAFAEALGHDAQIVIGGGVHTGRGWVNVWFYKQPHSTKMWTELPANLIIREFDRIKPFVVWFGGDEHGTRCRVTAYRDWPGIIKVHAEALGPDFKTAMARLRCKLEEEKA
jgi:hypothetical protein